MIDEKTWIEVSRLAIQQNLGQFRQLVGEGKKIMAVVKANAYGHGLKEIASLAEPEVDFFGVVSFVDAIRLREQGRTKPILIMGYTLEKDLDAVLHYGFDQMITDFESLKALAGKAEKRKQLARVHLKIETGTSRLGIFKADLLPYLELIQSSDFIELTGVFTHFANVEDTTDHSYAQKQLQLFKESVHLIDQFGFEGYVKHSACSAAAVLFPETYFDLVRVGISMYGMWSSKETLVSANQQNKDISLEPALTWKTRVAHIKTIEAGTPISYGCTESVSENTKIAVLPVGYWDGYDRGLSSIGTVLIGGTQCKVLGRVCMNMMMVNINHLSEVKIEDEVVLLGKQGRERVSAEEMANKIGTINYEVVTRINPLLPRKIVN